MANYIVLGSKSYDFQDEQGNQRKGATLYYIDEPLNQGHLQGYIPFTISVDTHTLSKIESYPCICDIEFKRIPNSKGRAVEVFDNLQFLQATTFTATGSAF